MEVRGGPGGSGIARGVERVIVLELIEWCMQHSSI